MSAENDRKLRMDPELEGVSKNWTVVTPSDTVDLEEHARYIQVLTTGDVKVMKPNGDVETITGVPAGTAIMGMVRRVYATGTHASPVIIAYF